MIIFQDQQQSASHICAETDAFGGRGENFTSLRFAQKFQWTKICSNKHILTNIFPPIYSLKDIFSQIYSHKDILTKHILKVKKKKKEVKVGEDTPDWQSVRQC